jgi:hypothetical protein
MILPQIYQMQPLAFQLPASFNPIISCTDEEAIPRYTFFEEKNMYRGGLQYDVKKRH